MLLLTCNTIEPDGSTVRGDLHPRCDLLLRLLRFVRNVLHLSLLHSPRRKTTWFLWMCFQILLIPLDFIIFVQAVVRVVLDKIVVEHDETVRSTTRPRCLPPASFAVSTLSAPSFTVPRSGCSSPVTSAVSTATNGVFLWTCFQFFLISLLFSHFRSGRRSCRV